MNYILKAELWNALDYLDFLQEKDIPKPDLIQIDEEEGVEFSWGMDVNIVIEKRGLVRCYFQDKCAPEGFWHFRFYLADLFKE